MRSTLAALGTASLLLIAAIGGAAAQGGDVEVKDIWARATPGAAQTAAVYATLQSAAGGSRTKKRSRCSTYFARSASPLWIGVPVRSSRPRRARTPLRSTRSSARRRS